MGFSTTLSKPFVLPTPFNTPINVKKEGTGFMFLTITRDDGPIHFVAAIQIFLRKWGSSMSGPENNDKL
jgi:hypothetical protein